MTTITDLLHQLETTRNLRHIPSQITGSIIDLSGNDYLGLAQEATTLEEEFLDLHHGAPLLFTSSASRLLSTRQDSHLALEETLEREYGEPAILFNSGYHANTGIIGSLASLPKTIFLADKLVHASIIDGLRISGSTFYRFRHNDIPHLKKMIGRYTDEAEKLVIVTESVFSMDGDRAPIDELIELKKGNPKIMLYVDEAHAFGVFGPRGLGLTAGQEVSRFIDLKVGTFGKAGASFGAFAICTEDMKQWIINTARSLIFSTALPPVNIEWSHFMFKKILELDNRRQRLQTLSEKFRAMISEVQCLLNRGETKFPQSSTQIIPLITGSSDTALDLSFHLKSDGILALPIRRPTVPPGTERIRFSLNALLPDEVPSIVRKILQRSYQLSDIHQ